MGNHFKQDASLHQQMLKCQRLVFQASIKANATPANKTQSSDMASAALLRTEGLTAQADAMENPATFSPALTSPADATGVFAVLIDTSKNRPDKLYKVTVSADTGTTAITSMQITPEGRIALDLDSDQDLSSQDLTLTIEVDYREE